MTHEDNDRLAALEHTERRTAWRRRVGILALILIVVGMTVGLGVQLSLSLENNRILEESQQEASEANDAAVEVAQEKQDQARSVSDLCESGEIDTETERGKRVCEEAAQSASEEPDEQVQAAKGAPGPPGEDDADGRGISDLQCGEDGRWDVTYTDGSVEDGGVCRESTREPTDPPPQAAPTIREQESAEIWPPAAPTV